MRAEEGAIAGRSRASAGALPAKGAAGTRPPKTSNNEINGMRNNQKSAFSSAKSAVLFSFFLFG